MDSKELRALQEAYNQVYDEEYKKLPYDKMIAKSNKFDKQYKTGPTKTDAEYKSTTDASRRRANTFLTTRFHDPEKSQQKSAANKNRPESEKRSKTASNEKKFGNRLTRSDGQGIRDSYEYDLYDIILSHLLDEGYADTEQAAEVIMVNMSEDWRESIVEGYQEPKFGRKDYIKKLSKRGGMGMGTPEDPHGYRDPKMAKVGAEFSKRKTAAMKAKKSGEPDTYRAEKEAQSKYR